jgi:hypothetical protein
MRTSRRSASSARADIAQYIYARGTANGKRVQAFGGAKNHGIVLPDADLDQVVNDLAGAAFGSAGERCMALPVVVPVGEDTAAAAREADPGDPRCGSAFRPTPRRITARWSPRRTRRGSRNGHPDVPIEGGELVVDGRGFTLQGHEKGFFIGPTLIRPCQARRFKSYKEEIFGPVLQMVRAKDFEEAVRLPSEHQYGNGVAIFTRNGHAAREFAAGSMSAWSASTCRFRAHRRPARHPGDGAALHRRPRSRPTRRSGTRSTSFPRDTIRAAAELGFGAIYVSEESGGIGLGRLEAALIMEAMAYGCPSTSAFISIHNMASWMIDRFGSDEVKAKYLPALSRWTRSRAIA